MSDLPAALLYYGGGIAVSLLLRTSLGWGTGEIFGVALLATALGGVAQVIEG